MAGDAAVLRWLAAEVRRLRKELDALKEFKVLEAEKRKDKRVTFVFDPEAPSFTPDPPTLSDPGPEKLQVSAFHCPSLLDPLDEENVKNSFEGVVKADSDSNTGGSSLDLNADRELLGHRCLSDVFGILPDATSVKHGAGLDDGGFVGDSSSSSRGGCDDIVADLAAAESPSRFLAEQEKEPEQPYMCDYRRHAERLLSRPMDEFDAAQAANGSLFVDVDSLYGVKLNLAFFGRVIEALTNPAWKLRMRKNIQSILDEYWDDGSDPQWVEDQVFYEIEDLRMLESPRC